jgi:hypothetical protein
MPSRRLCKSFSSRADKPFCVVMPIGTWQAADLFGLEQGLWPRHKRLQMRADSSPEFFPGGRNLGF